ncbi:pyridoxal 5'-phosphate synthase [Maribacter sp. HTCC2170]|uniref:pyridoxine/pyridoxamine 5'-phosphate oxidase n=1 Tax=Maribacter sp. (strain HTCC2170 / KCCM 42371) TaxID=313603 RepID=UPI00006B48F0|nr:pyridoxal 5'-phosphate synthase [Maribacter sp. HTCC2170]EAR00994.1 pyridoxamine 5'-phosphate oxidase [Maribacter sp. HTCC2170]
MENINQPIELFSEWYNEELKVSKVRIPSAVCFSTVGTDSFPNARFVSFKELVDNSFVITGPLNSRKGTEVENNENVALTFWWTETERQVRIQGLATKIPDQLANRYFNERSTNSQAVSSICRQGMEIDNLELLEKEVLEKVATNGNIQRPKNWSGFSIKPIRIEFMEFKKTRFHDRKLFGIENGEWNLKQIQP